MTSRVPRRIVVSRHYHGEGAWIAASADYGGPPEPVGTGRTPWRAVGDLLAWFDDEVDPRELDIEVETDIVRACTPSMRRMHRTD
jgi:hypothetical protein